MTSDRRAPPRGALAAVLLLAAWAMTTSCRGGEARHTATPEADRGIGVETTPQPARRIVSLVPSATETLRLLGAGDAVVGRTDFDTAQWIANRPSVGGGLHPSLESIVALEPDLVIHFRAAQDPDTPRRLEALGIRHFAVRPNRIGDVRSITRALGRLTGHAAAADSLVESMDRALNEIRVEAVGRRPVRVAYVLGGRPPWVAGPGTYIDELIRLAGGVNVFHDLDRRYSAVSPEEFVARDIDLVIVPAGADFDADLAGAAPVREVSPDLEIPGPSVVRGAREIARLIREAASR